MKNILILYQTHGNETIGKDIVELLKITYPNITELCDFVVGNPKAADKNIRFTECDLNRVAPGNINSNLYEERRASELISLFESYKYIIDIHETLSSDDIMLIIPNNSDAHLIGCNFCPVEKVIIWPSSNSEKNNPLVSFSPYGFELEIGTKNSYQEKQKTGVEIIYQTITNIVANKNTNIKYDYFEVVGKINLNDILYGTTMENFVM